MGKIQSKKIGSAIVYWTPNIFSSEEEKVSIPKKKGISSAIKKGKHEIKIKELRSLLKGEEERNVMLEKEIMEMKLELMDLRKQVHQQTLTEDFDNPWKEVAFNMAQILADTKGITVRETLIHFGASEEAF